MREQHYQYIDPTYLYRAVDEDIEAFRSLAKTYLDMVPPMLARLEQAILLEQVEAITHESHALKGTTALIGATHLTEQLRQVEALSRLGTAGAVDEIAHRMPEIRQLFEQVALDVQKSIVLFKAQDALPPSPDELD